MLVGDPTKFAMVSCAACLIVTGLLTVALPADEPDAAGIEFFEARIRPVLAEHCYGCHSTKAAAEKKLKGGLLVDSQDGLLKGGGSYDGTHGAVFVISTSGKVIQRLDLPARPVPCGLAATRGQLIVTCVDGQAAAFEELK
jgi:hypothetical protein